MRSYKLLFLIYIALIIPPARAETIISYPLDATTKIGFNPYHNYFREVLKLALDKTSSTYGSFKIIPAPPFLSPKRSIAIATAQQDLYPNLVFEMAYDVEYDITSGIDFILFPVDLGIMGHRVCFVHPTIKDAVQQTKTLADLRKYTIGQGLNWVDSIILRHNGFTVKEIDGFQNIFKMLMGGRIDLFCHGSNQILNDYNNHKDQINLVHDETFEFKYPLPRFFYLNAKNQQLKKRIETGLKLAYHDQSLLALWQKHFKASVEFANLPKRKVFLLENPLTQHLPKDWEQYIYNPGIEVRK